jgi:hypothetical protein
VHLLAKNIFARWFGKKREDFYLRKRKKPVIETSFFSWNLNFING